MKTTIRRMLMNTVIAMAFLAVMGVAAFAYEDVGPNYITGCADLGWPVASSTSLSSCFLDVMGHNGMKHNAIDIVADHGSTVSAAYDGVVVDVVNNRTDDYIKKDGSGSGFGNYVIVRHDNYRLKDGTYTTIYTRYSHLSSACLSVGDLVEKGEKIGTVGSTGASGGYHLDFQTLYGCDDFTCTDYQSYSIDPFTNYLLELPSGMNADGASSWCVCCYEYVRKVQELYKDITPAKTVEIPGDVTPSELTLQVRNNAWSRTIPGKTGGKVSLSKKGDTLQALGYIFNKYGNMWFFLDDGSYIYAENVNYVKTSTARGVKLSGPSTLRQGSSWSLTGSVYSDAIHSEITVSVTDSSGNAVLQGTEAFNHVYTLQGSSIDLRNMIFGNLTAGTYTYSITIRELLDNGNNACTEVTNTLYSRPFTVS